MGLIVADTNIVSYLFKNHTLADAYRPLLQGHTWTISFMTVAEVYEGAFRRRWGAGKLNLLERTLRSYAIVESSPMLAHIWGEVRAARWRQPIDVADAWIAATAIAYGCPLVTHNPKRFRGCA